MRRFEAAALLTFLAWICSGCLGTGKWQAPPHAGATHPVVLQEAAVSSGFSWATDLLQVPEIPVRKKLRFCCAFGTNMGVKVGELPLPWVKVGKVLGLEEVGPHRYDGATAAIDDGRKNAFPKGEYNGLIYTCRGGFIDTAHVRDYVDWTAFLVSRINRTLEHGTVIELPDEGGTRRLIVRPVSQSWIDRQGRREVVTSLAQWTAYQLSIWHEIATWYGWSVMPGYPETVSAFSPEDLYSNLVGIRLLDGVDFGRRLASERVYNENVDHWITRALRRLGAVPKQLGLRAVRAVDKIWWNSDVRLPEKSLLLRRNLDISPELAPWDLPEESVSAQLRTDLERECGKKPIKEVMAVRESLDDMEFRDLITLEIIVSDRLATQRPFDVSGRYLTQDDFLVVVEAIRQQNRAEFGLRADRPD